MKQFRYLKDKINRKAANCCLMLMAMLLAVTSTWAQTPAIGDDYQGGKVGYILQPGDPGYDASKIKGFVVGTADYTAAWATVTYQLNYTGVQASDIGTGASNTAALVNLMGPGNYLAYKFDTLTLGGYTDWYLPSQTEMLKIFQNYALLNISTINVGAFTQSESYLTSTEVSTDANTVYAAKYFSIGNPPITATNMNLKAFGRARPVRNFEISLCTPTTSTTTITSRGKYGFKGVDYTATGIYNYDTLVNAAGCDSILKLNLIILPEITTNTVTIGSTEYATQNLNVTHYRNGDLIPEVTDATAWSNLTTGAWCWYNNDSVNYAKYGRLYNWYAVNDPRGLAPVGYHVSTVGENNNLTTQTSISPESLVASGINIWSNNTAGTNMTGFAAFPNGTRAAAGSFSGSQTEMWLWSSSIFASSAPPNASYGGKLNWDGTKFVSVFFLPYIRNIGMSVRLVKDVCESSSSTTVTSRGLYGWNGVDYTASGTYKDTLINAAGCDSIATLNLTILPAITTESVLIGNQTWTTNNLAISHYRNGDLIPQVTNRAVWDTLTTGAWCWYNNDSTTYSSYGKLYNWYAINDPRGFGLPNFRMPTVVEYNTLRQTTTKLAEFAQPGINLWNNDVRATNISGFGVYPLGLRNGKPGGSTDFNPNGESVDKWTSTAYPFNADSAIQVQLSYKSVGDSLQYNALVSSKRMGLPVRLLGCNPTTSTTSVTSRGLYGWNGVDYTASGTYKDTLINATGCDSIATLNLTILPAITADTVRIYNQTWTTKNLNVTRYRNGDVIPQVTDSTAWSNLTTGAWSWYKNDSTNYAKYGKLYNWYAVNDPRGLAPKGYHVPTAAEATELQSNFPTDGNCFIAPGINIWDGTTSPGTDTTGFGLYPSGLRYSNTRAGYNDYDSVKKIGAFWLADDFVFGAPAVFFKLLTFGTASGYGGNAALYGKAVGIPVRLIKEASTAPVCPINVSMENDTLVFNLPDCGVNITNFTAQENSGLIEFNLPNSNNQIVLANNIPWGVGTNGTSTVSVDGTLFPNFSGIKILGGTGNDTLKIGSGQPLNMTNLVSGNTNKSVIILMDGASDQIVTNNLITAQGTGDVSINVGSGYTARVKSGGNITLQSAGDINTVSLSNATGTGVDVTSSNGGVSIAVNGIYTNGEVNVIATGAIAVAGSGISNTISTNNSVVNVISSASTITASGNAIDSKGKISLSAYGNIGISGAGLRNGNGTLGIDVITSNGGVTIDNNGIYTTGEVNVSGSGAINIISSGINNTISTNNSNVNVTSSASTITASANGVDSKGKITLSAYGDVGISGSGIRNGNGTLGIDVITSNGGVTIDNNGIYTNGEVNVSGSGAISINSSGIINSYSGSSPNVNVTSTASTITARGNAIDSKGKISLSAYGDVGISESGIRNGNGTLGIDVITSNGGVTIDNNGIYTNGEVNVSGSGAISITSSGIINSYSGSSPNVNVTSTASTITARGNAIDSKGKISLSAYGDVGISESGIRNGNGTLGIDVITSNGGVTIDNNGIYTNGEVNVSGSGAISITSSGIINSYSGSSPNVNVTSTASTITASANGVNSKGKITLSAYGDVGISGSGIRNGNGTLGIDVITSNGGVTIDNNGIYTNGEVNVSGSGAISINSSGIINSYSGSSPNVNVTSTASTITARGNAIDSKGKITLSAYGDVGISESGIRNGSGSLGIDVTSSNGGVSIAGNGIYSNGEVNVSGSGAINIRNSGISNAYSGSNSNVNVTSINDSILVTDGGIASVGTVTLNSNSNLTVNSNGVNNLYGFGVNLISHSGTIFVSDLGIRSDNAINFKSDKISIDSNSVTANASNVFIGMLSFGINNYNLGGDDTDNAVGLTNAELNSITADKVNFLGSPFADDTITVNAPVTAENIRMAFPPSMSFFSIQTTLLLQDSIKVKEMDLSSVDYYTTSIYSRTNAHALTVKEGVTIGSNTQLKIDTLVSGLLPGDSIVLIDNQSANAITGNFAGLNENDTLALLDKSSKEILFRMHYAGGDGNDAVLKVFVLCTPNTSDTTVSACFSYSWNGQNYTQSGTYTWTGTNVGGCDSTATLNLTITPKLTWYRDADGDGYGDPNNSTLNCTKPQGYVDNSRDCNDSNDKIAIKYWHKDKDGDGRGSRREEDRRESCSKPPREDSRFELGDFVENADDCNDDDSTIGNTVWYKDADGDGYGVGDSVYICDQPTGYRLLKDMKDATGDCDDTNASIYPNSSTAATSILASSTAVTAGGNVTLTVNGGSLGASDSWKWYSGSCGGTAIGSGTSIVVSPSVTTTYYLRAEGCTNTSCVSVTITACGPTGVTASAANNTICAGTSTTLTVQGALSGAASWKWYKNACGSEDSRSSNEGAIGSGSTLKVSPTATTTYYVRSEGGVCGKTICKSITITVNPKPSTPVTVSVPSKICKQSTIQLTVGEVKNATSYKWSVPAGWSIVSGQGTRTVTIKVGKASANVNVAAVNSCGTSANYAKKITVGNCTSTSSAVLVTTAMKPTADEMVDVAASLQIQAYPNPSTNQFTVRNNNSYVIQLRMIQVTGQVVDAFSQVQPGASVQFGAAYRPGIYLVEATGNGLKTTQKLIKQ